MGSPLFSAIALLGAIFFFSIVIPLAETHPKIRPVISRRWIVIVCIVAAMIGVLLDFSHLTDGVRMAVIVGGMILAGTYILIRTIEKCAANGWSLGVSHIHVEHGATKADVNLDSNDDGGRKGV